MDKELPWYKFSPNEWLSGIISLQTFEVQGFFVSLCAIYWKNNCKLTLKELQKRLRLNDSSVQKYAKELKSEGLITLRRNRVTVKFLDEQYQEFMSKKQRLSEAGRRGGKRSKPPRSQAEARLKPPLSQAEATPKHKEGEKETEKEGEGEKETEKEGEGEKKQVVINPPTPPDYILFFEGKNCHVAENEQWFFKQCYDSYTPEFLIHCIRICKRKKEGRVYRGALHTVMESERQKFNAADLVKEKSA